VIADVVFDEYDYEPDECDRCDQYGQVMACVDDMCRGLGSCVLGDIDCDGMVMCPDCGGDSKL